MSSLILHKHFSIALWRAMKIEFIRQTETPSSVIGLRSSKALPKAKLLQKKVMVTVWWSVTGLIHYSFLNPGKTITSEKYAQQIYEMHQKLQCLQLALVNRKGPLPLHDKAWPHVSHQCFKSWMKWAAQFYLVHHFHLTSRQPTTTSSSIWTTFCGKNASTTSRRQKMF